LSIIIGKSLAAYVIVRLFGHPHLTALTISASLAQIGEFSFILAGLGVSLALLPSEGRDLIMAGALISIVLNPLLFGIAARAKAPLPAPTGAAPPPAAVSAGSPEQAPASPSPNEVVLIGYGRTGQAIAKALRTMERKFVIVENDPRIAENLARAGDTPFVEGSGVEIQSLRLAGIESAKCLIVTAPDVFEAGQIVERARLLNRKLRIIGRAHSEAEVEHLINHGADKAVIGQAELVEAVAAWLKEQHS
jgi:CPA2 family monovalent cation:H+ antiporter-2